MNALAASLLIWISAHSGYRIDDLPEPSIVTLSQSEFHARAADSKTQETWNDGVSHHRTAYFDWDKTHPTLYIVLPAARETTTLDANRSENLEFNAHFVHQLVHYLQWYHGEFKDFSCRAQAEVAADTIAWNYLFNHGVKRAPPSTRIWTAMIDHCARFPPKRDDTTRLRAKH